MQEDEQAIRQLVATWMSATEAGDVETVLSLMTEDAVFLVAGRPPMHKADFAAQARAQATQPAAKFAGCNDIQEIRVMGDMAFMWTRLTVVITPPECKPMTRAGHTLTVLIKQSGKWLLARDANLLSQVS
jgi:uncharacterized protein (TIGR02246 family)